jgi:small subunit ribosomal protein S15
MSRTYARRRARLTAPIHREEKPEWLNVNENEIKELIADLIRKKTSLSDIGMILRDEYGIPEVRLVTGKGLKDTVLDMGMTLDLPDDIRDLMVKALNIRDHLERNRKDMRAKRDLFVTESRIRSLSAYYIKKDALPTNWRYSAQNARLLVGR